MRGKPPEIYGDGTQTRDFTYIPDVVDANHSLLTDDSADGETMNIGSTDNIDITTPAKVVRDEIDPTLDIEYTEARDGDAEHTHADISNAIKLIGYEPSRDIREGVGESIKWYEPLVGTDILPRLTTTGATNVDRFPVVGFIHTRKDPRMILNTLQRRYRIRPRW